jgi:hypothetical protein
MSKIDLRIDDVLLASPCTYPAVESLWRVTGFSPQRAYVRLVAEGLSVTLKPEIPYGLWVRAHAGKLYIERGEARWGMLHWNIGWRRLARGHKLSDEAIRIRVIQAIVEMRPHHERIRQLVAMRAQIDEEIEAEDEAERIARREALNQRKAPPLKLSDRRVWLAPDDIKRILAMSPGGSA